MSGRNARSPRAGEQHRSRKQASKARTIARDQARMRKAAEQLVSWQPSK